MANISRYQWEILAHLRDGKHQTAEQIFRHLKRHYFFISKWGVYKVLQKLAAQWLLDKHYHLGEEIVREISKTPHAHIYCEDSRQIIDVQTIPIDISALTLPDGFTLTSVNVTMTGTFGDRECTIAYKE